jgi:hypothetical protein
VRRRPSARFVGEWGGIGGSGANNVPSAPGCRTVRAPHGLSASASRTVRVCRALVGPGSMAVSQAGNSFLLQPDQSLILSSLSCSLSRKDPLLGDFDWGTPRTVRAHPRTLQEVLHHVIRVFFRISHSLSWILSKKVIRV